MLIQYFCFLHICRSCIGTYPNGGQETKDKAVTLPEMKANKKLIQQQLSQETGNIILLKDLSNIVTVHKEK